MANIKPKQPECSGPQFADSPSAAFGGKDNYLNVSYDQFNNEWAEDRSMHAEATPGKGSTNWSGNQYDDSPGKGGYGSYGVSVADLGKSPVVERASVDNSRADRGKES